MPVGTFHVQFHNDGTIQHEWAILKKGRTISAQKQFTEDAVLTEIEAINAGLHTAQDTTIRDPGDYMVICALHGHLDAGMVGTLHVVAPNRVRQPVED